MKMKLVIDATAGCFGPHSDTNYFGVRFVLPHNGWNNYHKLGNIGGGS